MITTWKTDNLGVTDNNQIRLPLLKGEVYDFFVDWGDGTTQTVTGSAISFVDHTFPSAGTYTVKLVGKISIWSFANGGDKEKLLSIDSFGSVTFNSLVNSFRGCKFLTSFPFLNSSNVTTFNGAWNGCSSLTSFPLIDTSNVTSFNGTWLGCTSLTSFPLIDTSSVISFINVWRSNSSLTSFPLIDTGAATNFSLAWYDCSSLTSFPAIDTAKGTAFTSTWLGCSSLTSFPLLDFRKGTNFSLAWVNCSSLADFPANAFDDCLATQFTNAFQNCALTQQSVDNILISINSNGTSDGTLNMAAGTNSAPSATGLAAKNSLISRGWVVTTN